MKQELTFHNDVDQNGNPHGGYVSGKGISIAWQAGPLGRGAVRKEPNGAFVEGVIQAAIGRLEFYQTASDGKFACEENGLVLHHLEEALATLEKRTQERETREIEGTNNP